MVAQETDSIMPVAQEPADTSSHFQGITPLTDAETDSLMRIIQAIEYGQAMEQQKQKYSQKRGLLPWLIRYLSSTNKPKDKPFDCSFVIGPFYDATQSFGLGAALSGNYSWDRADTLLPKSNISLFMTGTIKGMFGVSIEGNNFLPHDRWRINYKLSISTIPHDFWGIGYDAGLQDEHGSYHQFKIHFRPYALYNLGGGAFIGPKLDILHVNTYKFTNLDENHEIIGGQEEDINSYGGGLVFVYDTRDFILNPYKGQYLKAEQTFYPKHLNKYYYNSTDLTFCTYHKMWKKSILAFEYHSLFTYGGEVPWTMLAFVGDDGKRMRGYYEGRYRDRNIMEAQLEIRQMIKWRLGVTAFVGAANIFPSFDKINMRHTLPNYGIGLRWEFKPRINIRLDCGFTKNKPGIIFNMNEAF